MLLKTLKGNDVSGKRNMQWKIQRAGNGLSEIFGKERKLGRGRQGSLFCGEKNLLLEADNSEAPKQKGL